MSGVRMVYKDIAPGSSNDASVSATGQNAEISTIPLLPFASGNERNYTTCEHNFWALNGSEDFYDGGAASFWSAELSDADGKFESPPVITVTFGAKYSTYGVTLVFLGDCFCSNVNIAWFRGSAELDSKGFAPNSMTYFCENRVEYFDKLIITLYGTSIPRRCLRLDEIVFGVTRVFERDEIRTGSARIEQQIDPTLRMLYANTLDWTLSSKEEIIGAQEEARFSATGQANISELSLLASGGAAGDFAALEHNMWSLNGSFKILNGSVAFLSDALSDEYGAFATPPQLVAEFANRYSSPGIQLGFGGDSWCGRLKIAWYRGNTLLSEKEFVPDAMSYFCENHVSYYSRIVITMYETSIPGRWLRLNEISFLADMKKPLEYMFQLKQPISAYDGKTLIGVFYIEDSTRRGAGLCDLTCIDAIGVMGDDPFPDAYYENKNAYELAVEICDGYVVDMEDSLKDEAVTGIIFGQTRRGALQQLCFAIRAVANTASSAGVRIFTLKSSELTDLPRSRLRPGGKVKTSDVVTAVTVISHSYSTVGGEDEEGVKIGGITYYDTPAAKTITNPLVTPSDRQNVVEVADATLVSSGNVDKCVQYLYDRLMQRDTHSVSFRLDGETMGEYVETMTPWNENIIGHYTRGSIKLSGIAVTQAEVIGA